MSRKHLNEAIDEAFFHNFCFFKFYSPLQDDSSEKSLIQLQKKMRISESDRNIEKNPTPIVSVFDQLSNKKKFSPFHQDRAKFFVPNFKKACSEKNSDQVCDV